MAKTDGVLSTQPTLRERVFEFVADLGPASVPGAARAFLRSNILTDGDTDRAAITLIKDLVTSAFKQKRDDGFSNRYPNPTEVDALYPKALVWSQLELFDADAAQALISSRDAGETADILETSRLVCFFKRAHDWDIEYKYLVED